MSQLLNGPFSIALTKKFFLSLTELGLQLTSSQVAIIPRPSKVHIAKMAPNLADLDILEELSNDSELPTHAEVYWYV